MVLLPWGLFFFEAMASIMVIVFCLPLLLIGKTLDFGKVLSRFWCFFVIYLLLFISGFWSSDTDQWLNLLKTNVPYLVVPFALSLNSDYLYFHRRMILRHFIWAGLTLTIYLLTYLLLQPENILSSIRQGGSFPVPVHHVRTSLFLAIAALLGWNEWADQPVNSRDFGMYSVIIIVLIMGLHILAVRTGLLLFYGGTILLFLLDRRLWGRKIFIGISAMSGLAILSFLLIPTVGEKWNYLWEDIQNYGGTSWWYYSDAVRWRSNLMGWQIISTAPWWGVGMGDVLYEMELRFYESDQLRIRQYPHNQWITVMTGCGLIGLLFLNLALGGLFMKIKKLHKPIFMVLFVVFIGSCLVENTLFTSLGCIAFTVLFGLVIDIDAPQSESVFDRL